MPNDLRQSMIDNLDHTTMMINTCLDLALDVAGTPQQRQEAEHRALQYLKMMFSEGYRVQLVKVGAPSTVDQPTE